MHILIVAAFVLLLVFAPHFWARHILHRYNRQRDEIPGSGGEFAQHLLEQADMSGVKVEATELGDHYDPLTRVVRLSSGVFDGKSLTAVVVAAHEVGHAIQDQIGYSPLKLRTRLVGIAAVAEKIGSGLLVALPFIAVLTKAPHLGLLMLLAGFSVLTLPIVVHAVTLPVEFDASFRRALPILSRGYVPDEDLPAARRILLACALTYVAAALMTLLNFWRWIAILRR